MNNRMSAAVVALRPRAKEDFSSYLGMVILLGSWSILFGGLFFAYAGVRMAAPIWPPPGVPRLPLALPTVNTAVLAVSSVAAQRALVAIRAGRRQEMQALLAVTVFLGALFLGLQYVLWANARASGLSIDTGGTYGSVFYALTLFHAAHVAVGIGGLVYVVVGAGLGRWNAAAHGPVRLWTMFWHFVDAVWLATFLSVFLL
jgi:heme/copper-type cytochrome/quinol oxidase subunit 3